MTDMIIDEYEQGIRLACQAGEDDLAAELSQGLTEYLRDFRVEEG